MKDLIYDIEQVCKREKKTVISLMIGIVCSCILISIFANYGKTCEDYRVRWMAQVSLFLGNESLDGDRDKIACETKIKR